MHHTTSNDLPTLQHDCHGATNRAHIYCTTCTHPLAHTDIDTGRHTHTHTHTYSHTQTHTHTHTYTHTHTHTHHQAFKDGLKVLLHPADCPDDPLCKTACDVPPFDTVNAVIPSSSW